STEVTRTTSGGRPPSHDRRSSAARARSREERTRNSVTCGTNGARSGATPTDSTASRTTRARAASSDAPRVTPRQTTRGRSIPGNAPRPWTTNSKGADRATAGPSVRDSASTVASGTSPRKRKVRWPVAAMLENGGSEGPSGTVTATKARTRQLRRRRAYRLLPVRRGRPVRPTHGPRGTERPDLRPVGSEPQRPERTTDPPGPTGVAHQEEGEGPTRVRLRPATADPLGAHRPRDLRLQVDVAAGKTSPGPPRSDPVEGAGHREWFPRQRSAHLAKECVREGRVETPLTHDLDHVAPPREDPECSQEERSVLGAFGDRPRGSSESEPCLSGRSQSNARRRDRTFGPPRDADPRPFELGRVDEGCDQHGRSPNDVVGRQRASRLLGRQHREQQPLHRPVLVRRGRRHR